MSALLRTRFTLGFLILTFLGSACQLSELITISPAQNLENPYPDSSDWDYIHLRTIDPVDTILPSQDIIAAYVKLVKIPGLLRNRTRLIRKQFMELQIRIDLLEMTYTSDGDLFLFIDHLPGGQSRLPWGVPSDYGWDTYIRISADGDIRVYDDANRPRQDLLVRVERNPSLDTLVIDISGSSIQQSTQSFQFQLFTTFPDRMQIIDEVAPFRLDGNPPRPAQVLFAFWNTMPAYTPIQAIRRWDGAHTGPMGGRHGLYNLLRTARNERIPLVLLDLKSPISLVALDYLEALPVIQSLSDDGLLILPETLPEIHQVLIDPDNYLLPPEYYTSATQISREISTAFNLPASQVLSTFTLSNLPKDYLIIFWRMHAGRDTNTPVIQLSTPFSWRDKFIIPIPRTSLSEQASGDGLSLATRTMLVNSAFLRNQRADTDEANLLVLGGDLPMSEWGIPQIARSAFRYISEHPWISVLGADTLSALRSTTPNFVTIPPVSVADFDYPDPDLPGERVAWLALYSLYGPQYPYDESTTLIQKRDRNQIGLIQQAHQWALQPYEIILCETDIDLDGSPDCILATKSVFTTLSLKEGSIQNLFIRRGEDIHQIIAPITQFTRGVATSDNILSPGVVGAFGDEFGPYSFCWENGRVILDGDGVRKSFKFTPIGFQADIQSNEMNPYSIPLGLDPWLRFRPGWADDYLGNVGNEGWNWGFLTGPRVAIRSNVELEVNTFQALPGSDFSTENPDREIPSSQFIPFPMAIITTQGQTSFSFSIELLVDETINFSAK